MEIIKASGNNLSEAVDRAVGVISRGGAVVVPTDTVYGLAADAGNEEAIQRVFEIKNRPREKSLPVLVSSFEMLEKIALIKDERVLYFLKNPPAGGWPGKITCVFASKGGGTVGARMPNHDLVLKIIEKLGRPITGTSANVSGGKERVKISELVKEFQGLKVKPDLILDAGDLAPSEPSTVLDCVSWPPKILREGAVSESELKKFLGGDIL